VKRKDIPLGGLDAEVEKAQKLVRTDSLQMSVGELSTMYDEEELVVSPAFQRLFRWELEQKARLIESMLLGIPIPSIFVFERNDGTWELIDGLQRLSTIFEFMGKLKKEDSEATRRPSALISTKYLSSLHNVVWKKDKRIPDPPLSKQVELPKKYQLAIRRARINVQILKRPSEPETKYELFQRLNAGGTQANSQELRNSILLMLDSGFHSLLTKLARNKDFLSVMSLKGSALKKQRDMEYVSRFVVYSFIPYDGKLDIEEYIDEGLMELIESGDRREIESRFIRTFGILNECLGSGALRRFDGSRFIGRIGYTAFELIAVGISKNLDFLASKKKPGDFVVAKIKSLWEDEIRDDIIYAGMRGTTRISHTIGSGESWFGKE